MHAKIIGLFCWHSDEKVVQYKYGKTIVFGGSFDPVHVEHTNILKAAVRELCADKVIVVPTKNPPHKSASKTPFPTAPKWRGLLFLRCPQTLSSTISKTGTTASIIRPTIFPCLKKIREIRLRHRRRQSACA